MDTKWDVWFKQWEPPIEDKVAQMNMGTEENAKPIFTTKNMTLSEKKRPTDLIRECIDVFTWNYENMPGLDSEVAVHLLNIRPVAKLIKQQQRHFRAELMEVIKT